MRNKNSNKNIIIASESPDLYTTKRLLVEAKKLKYQHSWLNPYQYIISKETDMLTKQVHDSLYFHRTTGVRYDEFDMLVSKYHQNFGYKITNNLNSLEPFRNKDRQSLFFNEHKLPNVDTVIYRGELNEKYWEIISKLSTKQKYIIKMVRGNQGVGVNLINGNQSLRSVLETFHALKDQKFIIQPFIEHKKEWRVFVLKNEILAIVERKIQKEDFRGNSKFSTGKMVKKIPFEVQTELLRGVRLSGLDYCGVDIIEDGKKFYFLEFNPVPGFEQIEKLSNVNVAFELLTKL